MRRLPNRTARPDFFQRLLGAASIDADADGSTAAAPSPYASGQAAPTLATPNGCVHSNGQPSTRRLTPTPDLLLLICPVLNLNRSPSPSRVAFASDTLLPQPLLAACAHAYDGGVSDLTMWCDPLLSPALAPDDVLRRLPTTHIQVRACVPA